MAPVQLPKHPISLAPPWALFGVGTPVANTQSFLKPCSHSTPGTHAADWEAHLLGTFGQLVLTVSVAPIIGQH